MGKSHSNVYKGYRKAELGGQPVRVNGKKLDPRNDIKNHSPDGFEWGYGGSGPAQLALAILACEYDDLFAQEYYQEFKTEVIAQLDQDRGWEITSENLKDWVDTKW